MEKNLPDPLQLSAVVHISYIKLYMSQASTVVLFKHTLESIGLNTFQIRLKITFLDFTF